ncbi:c-type cytochrome [Desulfuromonas versatilis]|uniref:C-type cytochrome n=1 Tax=Desulfuromonas versatilis TaxID=2802975 RepID=A0ABN6DYV6_9BACT|nr:cytochrome c nitrite reductase small subunit [Desulfuromonas versatilis]BCR05303.1 c-type cytochrome [Desulfuromonas versatilis]
METKKLMTYVSICAVATVIGTAAFLVNESRMLSYLSSDPKVCINCHTMNTHYATWQHSSHREEATCVDCHLPRDSFLNKMIAKSRDGFNHSLAMTLGSYGSNLRVTDDAARRIQDNCISCHQEAVSQMLANSELYQHGDADVQMGRRCWDCHREVPHGTTRNLTTAHNNLGVKEL